MAKPENWKVRSAGLVLNPNLPAFHSGQSSLQKEEAS